MYVCASMHRASLHKKLFVVYLKFQFNEASCILPGNPIPDSTRKQFPSCKHIPNLD